jgi:hypothetical protein
MLWLAGCDAKEVRDAAARPLSEAALAAVFPAEGARRLLGEVPVTVAIGEGGLGEVPEVVVRVDDGEEEELTCETADEGTWADCGLIPATLDGSQRVSVSTRLAGEGAEVVAEADAPAAGVGWNLLDGTEVTRFGSGEQAVSMVNSVLDGAVLFLALDGYAGAAGAFIALGTPAHAASLGFRSDAPGFTLALQADVSAEGALVATADTAWLPMAVNGEPVQLLLLDVELTGTIEEDALSGARLAATVPAVGLVVLADAAGTFGSGILNILELDVDLDGDDAFDAASFEMQGAPIRGSLSSWGTNLG